MKEVNRLSRSAGRLVATVLLVVAAMIGTEAAYAQYPNKPIRFVVPFPAGGVTDVIARAIADSLSRSLGQAVVIENRAGADNVIAGEFVSHAKPDGYTLLFASGTGMSFAPATHKTMPYDPLTDFTPIGRIGTFGFFLYVTQDLPARDMRQLVEYGHANPGRLTHGSATGTALLGTTLLARSQDFSLVQVPYKGDAQVAPDLLTGRVQLAFASGVHVPQVKDDKLRALATALKTRSPLLPDVPTFEEAGIPNLPIEPWAGLFGPAGLPRDVVDRLSRELSATLSQLEVREQLERVAFEIRSSSPEELAAFSREQLIAWRDAARAAGLQPQ